MDSVEKSATRVDHALAADLWSRCIVPGQELDDGLAAENDVDRPAGEGYAY